MIGRSNILKSHPLLSLLPRAAFNRLTLHPAIAAYPKGTIIFNEGEPCRSLYLVHSGRCEARRALPNGSARTVEIFWPGDTFGDRELAGQGAYGTTVRVITDSVLQRIDSDSIKNILAGKERLTEAAVDGEGEHSEPPLMAETIAPPRLGRIVTLISLSKNIPDPLLAEKLAGALHAETGDSVLLVNLVSKVGQVSLHDWASIQLSINGEFCFADRLPKAAGGFNQLSLRITGDAREPAHVAPFLSHIGRHFRYVLLYASAAEMPVAPLTECIIQSDLTYPLLQPTSESAKEFDLLMRELRSRVKGDCSDIKPVVCLSKDERAYGFNELLKASGCRIHALVRGCPRAFESASELDPGDPTGGFDRDIGRLAREIGRCRIGLALSSGGAKGLAHIGVIQVLEENGIEVDAIAGCSMGAYVAAVWAYGYDGVYMEKLAREVEGRWGLWKLIDPVIPPRRGFMLGHAVINRLKKSIGDAHFSDMVRPLRIVATNLDTLERVIFSSGEVATAVHASSTVPGICVPIEIDGETYIDGGVSDPLPVDVLIEMGIERIIAVNTLPPPAFLRVCREKEREQAELLKQSPDKSKLMNRHLNYFAPGNILDVLMRAVHGAQSRVAEESGRHADLVLRPLSIDAQWHDFTHPGKYIALGRLAAQEHLEEIKSLANWKGHESKLTQKRLGAIA